MNCMVKTRPAAPGVGENFLGGGAGEGGRA